MLIYKIKTKASDDIMVYGDLAECPILDTIIAEPWKYEITELYLDRKGKVRIMRPISMQYMYEVCQFLATYRSKVPILNEPIVVMLGYSDYDEPHSYIIEKAQDVYMMAAKFACMMPRHDQATDRIYKPFLRVKHPGWPTKTFQWSKQRILGQVDGTIQTADKLIFQEMHLMEYLSGKTKVEEAVLQNIGQDLPQWRQPQYDMCSVRKEIDKVNNDISKNFFVPNVLFLAPTLQHSDKGYELESLVSLKEEN